MKLLINQWDDLEIILKKKEEKYLEEFFKTNKKPDKLFMLNGWKQGIIELENISFSAKNSKGYKPSCYNNKVTKKDIESFKKYIDQYLPIQVLVHYSYENGYGKASSATLFNEINSEKSRISTEKNKLEDQLKVLIEKFAPRENHFACTYCKVQTPIEKKVTDRIIGRGRKEVFNSYKGRYESKAFVTTETLDFCSATCAGNEQMSREG